MKIKNLILKNLLIILLILTPIFYLGAETASEIRDKIDDISSQIKKLDEEIAKYQNEINKTSEESKNLSGLIKELTLTRDKLLKEKQQTEKKITATGLVINTLTGDIQEKEKSINLNEQTISQLLYDLYQRDQVTLLEKILSGKTLSQSDDEYYRVISLNEELRSNIIDYSNQIEELSDSKNKKLAEEKNLKNLKEKLSQQQKSVEISKSEKDKLLKETKNKEEEYKRILEEKKKAMETFEKALEDYESQLKFILDPKSLPKAGSGPLAWPLDSVLITSLFGERWGRFHYGLDFRASIGTPVKTMASGKVLGTGDTDIACKGASFGKWILIKHNNGLSSAYGHLSSIKVSTGQNVKAGEVIGFSGNTGYSTAPHLHINVYASTGVNVETVPSKSCNGKIFTQPIAATKAYLDPLLYLPKTTKSMFK